jgi:azurin|tara:strand:+ start:2626 stop:3096 length:471 start_codon:yes stop_codon:yes gene_type:complete
MNRLYILFLLIAFSCGGNNPKTKIDSNNESSIPKEIKIILSSNDNMLFDKQIIYAFSRQKITLTLNHNGKLDKKIMGHNFVLLKAGVDVVDFATRALEARDNEYIPEGDETIAYTKLIGGGESDTITFDAPTKGSYNYICSFPGHYGIMKGILVIK